MCDETERTSYREKIIMFARNIAGSPEILKNRTVAIAGCGGLGSNIAISLVRSGVGRLIIADFDKVELSNLNRQQFVTGDIGKPKVEVLAHHLKNINPEVEITAINQKLSPENIKELFKGADILIEAFDLASSKLWLIESWLETYPSKPVVAGSGMAGLGNFEKIHVRNAGNLYICGDETSEMSMGLMAPRVAIVANLQAMTALEILLKNV
ncbi:MAG TPA: sulfur carrier protein ThiS adenylyltransferase ThiF [bacterium]|nr:sulfur carrier protein ThiS adenylyltransferase ThiF [bacterium]